MEGFAALESFEGGGRLVVEMSAEEASDLGDALKAAAS